MINWQELQQSESIYLIAGHQKIDNWSFFVFVKLQKDSSSFFNVSILCFSFFYILVIWVSSGIGLLDGQNETPEVT